MPDNEHYIKPQPEREFAPNITSAEEFARRVEEHPFFKEGAHKSPEGRERMRRAITEKKKSHAHAVWDSVMKTNSGDPINTSAHQVELIVLEHLIFHGEAFH